MELATDTLPTDPTPASPVLVYSDGPRAYRLRLYLEPPRPGVEPYAVDVPLGLGVMTAGDHQVCIAQAGFHDAVQTIGGPAEWRSLPRKQVLAMLGRTRDVPTLEHLATLDHHPEVVAQVLKMLGEVRPARGRRSA